MKERLDKLLVDKGTVESRERAKALIMEGNILVNRIPVIKSGTMVDTNAVIELKGGGNPYVSRGGLKLKAAIEYFHINLKGIIAMDVGSSTGGFTDCMLKEGAAKVYCIDVGYGQLAWQLRNDPRIVLLERTNIRHLERDKVSEIIGLSTIDASFISLQKILPKVIEFLKPGGEILALVKPQFEVGKGEVGKGGIVREDDKRIGAVNTVKAFAEEAGLMIIGVFQSPVKGQKGNIEYFLYMRRN